MSRNKPTARRRELMQAISLEIRRSQNRTDAFDEAVANALHLNRTDLRCLDVIDQESPITAGRLAELMHLTTGAITTVLDRLERAGYARRVRDAQDRRRVHVELTQKAREDSWRFYGPLAELAEKVAARYSDEQLELILDFLRSAAEMGEAVFEALNDQLQQ